MTLAEAQMEISALSVARYSNGLAHIVEQIDVHHDADEGFYANIWWFGMGADDYPSRINLDLPSGLDCDDIKAALTQYPSHATH